MLTALEAVKRDLGCGKGARGAHLESPKLRLISRQQRGSLTLAMKAAPFAGNIYQQNPEIRATSGTVQALAHQWLPASVQIRKCLEIIQPMISF